MSGVDGGDDRSGGGIDLKDYPLDGHAAMPARSPHSGQATIISANAPMTREDFAGLPPLRYQAALAYRL